jgi:hypothetical protein
MKFTLTIETGNEAMLTGEDLAKALKGVAKNVASIFEGGEPMDDFAVAPMTIRDANGNRVGSWDIA